MPFSTLSTVDLPAPFSPMSPTTSPLLMAKLTSSSAFTPGKLLETLRISSTGAVI